MQNRPISEKKNLQKKLNSLDPPIYLNATTGDLRGEIDLSWEPVKEASSYVLQKSNSANRPLKWKYEDIVTRSRCTVSNLKSNHCYWFRIAAITSAGKTGWSAPVKKKAP